MRSVVYIYIYIYYISIIYISHSHSDMENESSHTVTEFVFSTVSGNLDQHKHILTHN